MLKTLDRYVIRNFLYSYLLWFLVMMGLRIVADLFVNMDEFTEQGLPFFRQVAFIGSYYLYQSLVYFQELGGLILTAGASFALARMNHTNELTAVLASGVSLHRVVAPVIVVGLALASLDVVNQEALIPRVKEHLVRSRDDVPGTEKFEITALSDLQRNVWWSREFVLATGALQRPMVIQRDQRYKAVAKIAAESGQYASGGQWGFQGASIAFVGGRYGQTTARVRTWLDPARFLQAARRNSQGRLECLDADPAAMIVVSAADVDVECRRLIEPQFQFLRQMPSDGSILPEDVLAAIRAPVGGYSSSRGGTDPGYTLEEGELTLPTDMTPRDMTLRQSSRWLGFMSSAELGELLKTRKLPDPQMAMVARHSRFTQPLSSLFMLLLGLPFILSRERNIKSSAALCLGVVALFYVAIFVFRYLGQYRAPGGEFVLRMPSNRYLLRATIILAVASFTVLFHLRPAARLTLWGAGMRLGACVIGALVGSLLLHVAFQAAAHFWSPLLAAWLPLLIFGPIAVLMLDSLRT